MQTEPEQWAVTEADIEGAPDWAFSLASTIVLGNYGCGHAAVLIQRAFEERERKLREAIQERDILIAELIAKAAIAVALGGDVMWQRFNDEAIAARQALKETPDAQ